MFKVLDSTTLFRLLDAAPEAVFHTIETGGWSGCVWPGNEEWEMHEPCAQVRSLAIHYATVRHPGAETQRYEILAQTLASQVCPRGPHGHLDADPLVQHTLLWLWVLSGGPSPPENPPEDPEDTAPTPLPGGDAVAFTTASLELLEAFLFSGEVAAQQVATNFLQRHHDELTHRGLELVAMLSREQTAQAVDDEIVCSVCGADGLESWYSGQTWGEVLCEPCYEARVEAGQARAPKP
jgi:hypothetical protein